jgi:hypothetical protein
MCQGERPQEIYLISCLHALAKIISAGGKSKLAINLIRRDLRQLKDYVPDYELINAIIL